MLSDAPCSVNFFDWLDALSDEEHHQVLEALRCAADDLGVIVEQQPFVAQNLFHLPAYLPPKPSLN